MKVVVSDFDRTLFRNIEELDEDIKAIKKFQKAGNLFIINTGRNLTSLLQVVNQHQIPFDYLICGDGTKIFNNQLEELHEVTIDDSLNKMILDIINESGCVEKTYIDDGFQLYTNPNVVANTIIGKLLPDKVEVAQEVLQKILNQTSLVHGYLSHNWINILPANCNKKIAIDFLAKMKKWKQNDIYTIGDDVNDFEMVKGYLGYAMDGAYPELKEIARGIYPNISKFLNDIEEEKI